METKTYTSVEEMVEQLHSALPWWKKCYYSVYRFFDSVSMIPKEVQWFIQRGRRGFSDSDTWGFDLYLAKVIRDGVKQIRENRTGYPSDPDMTEEKWDGILGKISDGFGKLLEVSDNPDLWDDEKVKAEISEAKQLFVKYFEGLWD